MHRSFVSSLRFYETDTLAVAGRIIAPSHIRLDITYAKICYTSFPVASQ